MAAHRIIPQASYSCLDEILSEQLTDSALPEAEPQEGFAILTRNLCDCVVPENTTKRRVRVLKKRIPALDWK